MPITKHHALICRTNRVEDHQIDFNELSFELTDSYYERLGIDDARQLIARAHIMPIAAEVQCLIVRADFITLEAQNALLKVLEEPPISTKFVFIVPRDLVILATLESRFETELIDDLEIVAEPFQAFLKQSLKDRLQNIEITTKKKDTVWIRSIKQGLISYLTNAADADSSFSELEFVARTLLTRGSSNKMLLEHAALILKTR